MRSPSNGFIFTRMSELSLAISICHKGRDITFESPPPNIEGVIDVILKCHSDTNYHT